ncbi:MAG: TIGR00730 family Rossman fold protein [Thermoanaerobaculia bacterium]
MSGPSGRRLRRLCVYCGSHSGRKPAYSDGARRLGRLLGERRVGLVYGGGRVGLMGVLADAALEAGAEVIGIIPEALEAAEVGHRGLTELRVVASMHERKAQMVEMSDAFVALPGGLGTLDELFEVWTWGQLGLHAKPCGLLDTDRYFASLLAFLDRMVEDELVRPEHRRMLLCDTDPESLLDRLETYSAPTVGTYLRRDDL